MKYELPQLSEDEFNTFHTFVKACFDQGRQRFSPELRRITTERDGFSPHHTAYLKTTDSLAVCMEGFDDYQTQFDIWVNPQYKEASPRFFMTLAHELTHGYAGLKYGHNAHWRRWYYRVLWHIKAAGFFKPEDPVEHLMYSVECMYNQASLRSGVELIHEAMTRAESEHSQVMSNFSRRMMDA